jgi:hypothetical protein
MEAAMKYLFKTVIVLAVLALLCGCRQSNPPIKSTPMVTSTPSVSTISSYPPGKTASQDTAGAVTKLPEAATAAATVDGTLAP